MNGKQVQAAEEDGYIEWNEERGCYEAIDEEGLFMHTIQNVKEKPSYSYGNLNIYPKDRHDSDAEDLKREAAEDESFDAMADAGMSMRDFI